MGNELNTPLDIYDIQGEIGEGGGGKVILAFHKRLQKKVVIKRIHESIDINERRTEVDILKNLRHSYLPQVLDYFVIDNVSYTVMDYIEGESFQSLLNKGVKFKESQVIKYGKQLCEAVEYLHSRKIPVIHGDIKPDNIMLTPEDNICLIDFNISGISEGNQAYTMGCTIGYSAPEQIKAFEKIISDSKEKKPVDSNHIQNDREAVNAPKNKTEILNPPKTEMLPAGKTEILPVEKTEIIRTTQTEILSFDNNGIANQSNSNNKKTANGTELLFNTTSNDIFASKKEETSEKSGTIIKIPIDKRSDVYSIGATLFHLYTGKRLDETGKKVLKAGTSEGYLYILNKSLSEKPSDRFASAGDMLKAFNYIHKKEKKYKMMIARQSIIRILLAITMIAGIWIGSYGFERMKSEKDEQYADYISRLEEFEGGDSLDDFQSVYELAINLHPEREEAYYQKVRFLYLSKDYESDIDYIDKVINDNNVLFSPGTLSQMLYIEGNAYYNLEIFDEAADSFEKALKYNSQDGNIYTDYAMSLAKLGDTQEAQEALKNAEEKGADKSFIYLAKGEIEFAEGKYIEAEESLKRSIENSEDDYKKMRAYSTCSKAMMKDLTLENVERTIIFLNEGVSGIDIEYRGYLINILADAYGSGYSISGDLSYAEKAIESYDNLISTGWANINTYNNIIILCTYCDKIDLANNYLEKMTNLYSENYISIKRKAFLELEVQNLKEERERDYSQFVDYYFETKDKYEQQSKGKTDPEMQLLEQDYQRLIEEKWIEGE